MQLKWSIYLEEEWNICLMIMDNTRGKILKSVNFLAFG
jgi:hypothetical protein